MNSTKFAIVRWMGEALCRRLAILFVFGVAGWLVSGAPALAADDFWDTAASGTWQIGSNWLDNTTPAVGDTANFDLAGAYTVTFDGTPPAIEELSLSNNANVTFTSISTFETQIGTLSVDSGPGLGFVSVSDGAILSLGTSGGLLLPNKVLHLTVGDELRVLSGSTLNVRFGSDVVTSGLFGTGGQVNVSGSGSTLTATNLSSFISIGSGGSLNVTSGGLVQSDSGLVGFGIGTSTATISGAGSQWINTFQLFVGFEGQGTLDIIAGGMVQGSGVIGGTVNVSGIGSLWNGSLKVGGEGGILNVADGGRVASFNGSIGVDTGSFGTATVSNGEWTMTGSLRLGLKPDFLNPGGRGVLNIEPAGTVSVGSGVTIYFDGKVFLNGGTLDTGSISFEGGGQFDFTAGTLHAGSISYQSGGAAFAGVFNFAGGTLHAGSITVPPAFIGGVFDFTAGTLHVETFNGSLTNQGGTLAPGDSAGLTTINGSYTQQASAALEIEIGGLLAGSQSDFVNVNGTALLGGQLQLNLIDDFMPAPTNSFTVFEAQGGIAGVFSNVTTGQRLTTIDGNGSFLVHYGATSPFNANQIVLTDFLAGLSGDFDFDNDVDGLDFLKWQRGFGDIYDGDDLADWEANYGTVIPLSAAATVVPEPSTELSLLLGMVTLLAGRRTIVSKISFA